MGLLGLKIRAPAGLYSFPEAPCSFQWPEAALIPWCVAPSSVSKNQQHCISLGLSSVVTWSSDSSGPSWFHWAHLDNPGYALHFRVSGLAILVPSATSLLHVTKHIHSFHGLRCTWLWGKEDKEALFCLPHLLLDGVANCPRTLALTRI